MLAIVCPGQGSQQPGLLAPWLEHELVRVKLAELLDAGALDDALVNLDLLTRGSAPDADVVDTAVAQPLIALVGLAVAAALPAVPSQVTLVAGHSIGELTAAGVTGALAPIDALRLAVARGRAMAAAAELCDSGMTAILGGDPADVEAAAIRAGASVANRNGPGQIVIGGTVEALARFAADPPARARLRPLAVAGAFHTDLMAPAETAFDATARQLRFSAPRTGWVSGLDGAEIADPERIRRRLVKAMTAPVRFDLVLSRFVEAGVTGVIELPPAGVLTALVKRHLPTVDVVALTSPDDLDAAAELIAAHRGGDVAEPHGEDPMQIAIAPADGVWHQFARGLPRARSGESLSLGAVVGRHESVAVDAPAGQSVAEWLTRDGDPVRRGQPLARLVVER